MKWQNEGHFIKPIWTTPLVIRLKFAVLAQFDSIAANMLKRFLREVLSFLLKEDSLF